MKRSEWAAMAALCLWSGSGWLLTQAFPSTLAFPAPELLHFSVIAVLAGLASMRGPSPPLGLRRTLALGLAAVSIFGLPVILLNHSAGAVSSYIPVTVFAAIPLIAALAASALSETAAPNGPHQAMTASLIGLAGAFLLFPAQLPASLRSSLMLAAWIACAVAAAFASLFIRRLLRGVPLSRALAVVATANAAIFALTAIAAPIHAWDLPALRLELLRGAGYELPLLVLTLWLMARVEPVALTARYLLVPIVTVLEGAAIWRTPLELRTVAALALLGSGGLLLLRRKVPPQMPKLFPD